MELIGHLILLSWSSHVNSWSRGMGTFGNGIVHPDASPIQLHAIGSLHCLGNTRKDERCYHTNVSFLVKLLWFTEAHSCYTLWPPLRGCMATGWGTLWQDRHLVVESCKHTQRKHEWLYLHSRILKLELMSISGFRNILTLTHPQCVQGEKGLLRKSEYSIHES